MKRILLLLAALWFARPSFATMQMPEQLIVGRDTMPLFVLPLATADHATQVRIKERLNEADTLIISSACWRGYVGYWRLEEGQLWLERLDTFHGKPLFTAEELFPELAEQGRVRASWFSGEICYGRGEKVYIEDRMIYEEEWTATVEAGRVVAIRPFKNRVNWCSISMRKNVRRVSKAFDRLGPTDSLPSQLLLSVRYVPDSTGRPARIKSATLTVGESCITDPSDPLVQRACQAFREASVWDVVWIHGEIQESSMTIPLRRARTPASSPKRSE